MLKASSTFNIMFELRINFSSALNSRRIDGFFFLFCRCQDLRNIYFDFFSPCSYQFALDLINLP